MLAQLMLLLNRFVAAVEKIAANMAALRQVKWPGDGDPENGPGVAQEPAPVVLTEFDRVKQEAIELGIPVTAKSTMKGLKRAITNKKKADVQTDPPPPAQDASDPSPAVADASEEVGQPDHTYADVQNKLIGLLTILNTEGAFTPDVETNMVLEVLYTFTMKYGAPKVKDLKEEHYGDVIRDVESFAASLSGKASTEMRTMALALLPKTSAGVE